jgi:CheY-like chemotaxis protein
MADQPHPRAIEILLVDDNDDDIVLLQESLKESKFLNLLHVVRDGTEALEWLRAHRDSGPPGLILLDINMPRMNGFEVLSALKSDPALRGIPVVMLTTSTREEDVAQSYAGGACSFVSKPVNFEKLKEVIKHFELYWTLVAIVPPARQEATSPPGAPGGESGQALG